MANLRKCAVVGCGFVGSSSAFALMESGLFNDMVLIDINKKKAEGEALDISHGVPFARPIEIFAGTYEDLCDAGIVVIAAGANQGPGETRIDLVHKNTKIFQSIIPEIAAYAKEAILLIVTNPVDILTWVTWKLSGFPKERVIGSGTVLDSARLKYLLGKHLNVDSRAVHAFIIGEHGDSEVAVWSSANISGIPLKEFSEMKGFTKHQENRKWLYEEVKNSAYQIIERKGATYYGIAASVRRICECIVRDEHSILPVTSVIDGHFGLHDICLGVPSVVSSRGVEEILEIPINEQEQQALQASAAELNKIMKNLQLDK